MSSSSKKNISISVAIVDDSPEVATTLSSYLRLVECDSSIYTDPSKFLSGLKERHFDVVITDFRMPGIDGLTLLKQVKKDAPETDVIIVTGHADKDVAIQALRAGAHDLLEKPVSSIQLVGTIRRIIEYRQALKDRDRLSEQVSVLSERVSKKWGIEAIVGDSKAFAGVLRDIRKLQKTPGVPVLITGESGSGKELVAHAIHVGSSRADRPFVPLNCAAVPSELAESILFGHSKGAFTGASSDKKGSFDMADGGTLFLDEIGDMPAAMQTKLLRVLEDGIVTPVGSTNSHKVNTRIIAATNVQIEERIEDGRFRTDLFYRLSTYTIKLPPLHEHKADIPVLAEHFVKVFSEEMGVTPQKISHEVLKVLDAHDYPGNVRELKNVVERALIESSGKTIEPNHINFPSISRSRSAHAAAVHAVDRKSGGGPKTSSFALETAEKEAIQKAMNAAGGNVSSAARLLGIARAKLYRKLASYGPDSGK